MRRIAKTSSEERKLSLLNLLRKNPGEATRAASSRVSASPSSSSSSTADSDSDGAGDDGERIMNELGRIESYVLLLFFWFSFLFLKWGFFLFFFFRSFLFLLIMRFASTDRKHFLHHLKRNDLKELDEIETSMFKVVKTPHSRFYVELENGNRIWTLAANVESKNVPIVIVHGFCGGIGFWIHNVDTFAEHHPFYAFDLLGYSRSSRPKFSDNAQEAEKQFLDSIEEWRDKMNINEMILFGHSFGGFLATAYATKYPKIVKALILVNLSLSLFFCNFKLFLIFEIKQIKKLIDRSMGLQRESAHQQARHQQSHVGQGDESNTVTIGSVGSGEIGTGRLDHVQNNEAQLQALL